MAKTFSYISPPFRLVASAACKKARLYSSMSRKVRKAFRQRTFDPSRRTTTGCSRSERALGTLFDCLPYGTLPADSIPLNDVSEPGLLGMLPNRSRIRRGKFSKLGRMACENPSLDRKQPTISIVPCCSSANRRMRHGFVIARTQSPSLFLLSDSLKAHLIFFLPD